MAWPASGMALATMAARVAVLLALVMISLAPALAKMAAHVTFLLVMVSLAPALALLLLLPALVLAGTRAQRLELKTRRRVEASGLVRGGRQQQQLPRLQGAAAAAA